MVLGGGGQFLMSEVRLDRVAKPENRCVVVTEAGSYLRLTDFCITQLKAQGPSRTCNECKEEEEKEEEGTGGWRALEGLCLRATSIRYSRVCHLHIKYLSTVFCTCPHFRI